jgi:hypothetical protein
MEMPRYDFKPPKSLAESLQRFTLELNSMMVWLRNEARFHLRWINPSWMLLISVQICLRTRIGKPRNLFRRLSSV